METSGGRRRRDDQHNRQPPPLSIGLTSVRFIVDRLEARHARAPTAHDKNALIIYDRNKLKTHDADYLLDHTRSLILRRFIVNLGNAFVKCIPEVSHWNFGALAVVIGLLAPRMFTYFVVYPFCRLVFGTLYPAYASYKAVRTKNLKEYVKWMMYWIVFALFTCTETFTDVFLSWFPFYYEVKIVIVLWLLSPATKGSSILYRKFVHPALCRREQEIDEYIAKAKDQGYHTVLNLGTKGVNYATTVIMQTAIKGGGGLVQQIRKSYSLSDLTDCDAIDERARDEADDVMCEPHVIRRTAVRSGYNTRRSASESNGRGSMYFSEIDVDVRTNRSAQIDEIDIAQIKSSEDISSGYSSADNSGGSLTRTASVGAAAKTRARQGRSTVTSIKRPQAAEDSEVIIEEVQDDENFEFSSLPPLVNVSTPLYMSHTNPPFIYQYVGDQVRILQVIGDAIGFDNREIPNRDQRDMSQDKSQDISTNKANVSTYIGVNDECNTEAENVTGNCNSNESGNKNDVNLNDEISNKSDECDASNNIEIIAIPVETTSNEITTFANSISVEKNILVSDKELSEIKNTAAKIESEEIPADLKRISLNEIYLLTDEDLPQVGNENIDVKHHQITVEIDVHHPSPMFNDEVIEKEAVEKKIDRTIDDDSPQSDDEASFGTPDDSPKTKRKSPKGKYGKAKAPPPPNVANQYETTIIADNNISITTSQESLLDLINASPKFKETSPFKSQIVNPIAEVKRRHKSKSPRRIVKSNNSAIGKLLQIPGKLAFWNKNDRDKKNSDKSISSEDDSRRSSTIDKSNDELIDYVDVNESIATASLDLHTEVVITAVTNKSDDQISFKDASDFESEVLTHDITEKSDVLQKLIDAKIESHPEYKFIPLEVENDRPSISKSTDV